MNREQMILEPLELELPSVCDSKPTLMIEDGLLPEIVARASDDASQQEALDYLRARLYPNEGWCS